MAMEHLTKRDLELFGQQLLAKMELLIAPTKQQTTPQKNWIKSHQVQRMLAVSSGTLATMRTKGVIPYTKIGGVFFYDKQEILKVLEINERNKCSIG